MCTESRASEVTAKQLHPPEPNPVVLGKHGEAGQ